MGDSHNRHLHLRPVAAEESGEGYPYAPENWPEPGDIWGWRTGRRVTSNGNFQDRYLYLPSRLSRLEKEKENPGSSSRRKQHIFPSKLAVERYVKATFPDADLTAFFASFSWKIPAIPSVFTNGNGNTVPIAAVPLQQVAQAEESDSDGGTDVIRCKAMNKMCYSLVSEIAEKHMLPCDICCDEDGFCRYCCCILCCRTVDSTYGGYTYIKCQINAGEGICGHVAHLECGLRARMAGTVGGLIGLDAEYHCRRCDGRTDLIPHVNNIVQACNAADLDDEIKKKILNLGFCILRGSEKPISKELMNQIELVISKLHGINLEDILKEARSKGFFDHDNDVTESFDYLPNAIKLEVEVDQVLQALRKSQEFEYTVAEERLRAHKTYLLNLYQQLDFEKSESARRNSGFGAVREREEQIRREVMKFKAMKKVANGFGRASKDILKEHFDLEMAD